VKKYLFLAAFVCSFASCKKCFDCSNLCVRCINAPYKYEACGGEDFLNGMTVVQWREFKKHNGYTCVDVYKNDEVCGKDAKDSMETQYYECEVK